MNCYDDEFFFNEYKKMDRSRYGLKGAGEWHEFKKMMPDFKDKKVLDLGCGYGWHCMYAVEMGAKEVTGIDASYRMIEEAKIRNSDARICYKLSAIESFDYPEKEYDVVISSLVLHYIESFEDVCQKVKYCLKKDGEFVFSVEHPIFTAQGKQDWYYENGSIAHWPVDRYFEEGKREAVFLGEQVIKYHKTLTTYLSVLLKNGFEIISVVEPEPDPAMLEIEGMKDELRRPMMLLIKAKKC